MNSRTVASATPLRPDADRPPLPVNIEAEQALLGAILINNTAYGRVAEFLVPEHFGNAVHGRIYAATAKLIERGQIANPITLKNLFDQDGALAEIGGAQYLARLAEAAVTIINAEHYGRTIHDLHLRRELITIGQDVVTDAFRHDLDDPALGQIERAEQRLIKIAGFGRSPRTRTVVDPTSLQNAKVPERRWIVQDWIPDGVVTGLYGSGGLGKTLAAQQLLTASAIGKPWLGRPVVYMQSMGVFCEDSAEELHRRQADINRLYEVNFADLGAMRWLPRLGYNNLLMTFDHGEPKLTAFFGRLVREARAFGARLAVIDTVADCFGGDENNRGQVRQFIQACLGRLAREIDGAVLALAHPSRSGQNDGTGQSGSTAWDATFRSRLYLSTPSAEAGDPPDPDARILTRVKANYAPRAETVELRWKEGVFVTQQQATGIIGAIERRAAERVFLDLVDRLLAEGQAVSSNIRAGNYAPRLFAQRPDREGYRHADFERAMQVLFAEKRITSVLYGRRSDERRRIERVPEGNP
jgi:RecA-family ATPase